MRVCLFKFDDFSEKLNDRSMSYLLNVFNIISLAFGDFHFFFKIFAVFANNITLYLQ